MYVGVSKPIVRSYLSFFYYCKMIIDYLCENKMNLTLSKTDLHQPTEQTPPPPTNQVHQANRPQTHPTLSLIHI